MATKAVIHNGCTTGVEAYVMGIPAISYRPTINEHYDDGFYRLPNKVSHQCFDFDQLQDLLQKITTGQVGAADGDERAGLIKHYLAANDGPLACERMVDVLENIADSFNKTNAEPIAKRIEHWVLSKGLKLARGVKSSLPGSHNKPEFQRHRYPGIPIENIKSKLAQFQKLLGYDRPLQVEQESDVIFRIN